MILTRKLKALTSTPINWVLLTGCLLRLYSAMARGIINRDGHHYIYQAQAIFSGKWPALVGCELHYISIYPFFIAAANTLFHDWVVAGIFVNVILGSATLFPLYYLLRKFANETICAITLLVYALMPTFVNSSGDIVRGPVFWFFLSMGMFMFIRQWDQRAEKRRYRYDLLISCFFFLLAAGTRIEGAAFIATSMLYLLIARTDRKFERTLIFLSPMVCLALAALTFALISHQDIARTLRIEKIGNEITQFVFQYKELDSDIKTLYMQQHGLLSEFLHRIRESLWLIPFGIILHNIIEVFFYPFALVFFIGFIRIRQRAQAHPHSGYLLWLMLAAICVLYVHLLHAGIMIHRFFAILILPSCIVIANGVGTSIDYIQKRFQLKHATAAIVLVLFFFLTGLPKVLKPKEEDGIHYRQAAQLIANKKSNDQVERIASAERSAVYDYIFLYAHRNYPGPLCGVDLLVKIPADADNDQMVALLDNRKVRYLLYEERYWPSTRSDFLVSAYQSDFHLLWQWQKSNNQRILLFERITR
jgi:4-amino-4-deoxy-L-arabinose transferase-like glycosyltransferase